jgi:thymidine kinase
VAQLLGEVLPSSKMRLTLIMGPMFAGKSSAVITKVRRAEVIGWKTLIITSSIDTRYESTDTVASIITHDKNSLSALGVSVLKGVCERADYIAARLIVIEEGQFFPDLYEFVIHAVEKDGKDVIVVGLDGDSDRKPFGQMLELVPMADEILRLTSLCKRCGDGSPALFSALVRGVAKSAQIFVGANDMYEAMCRKHYLENSLLSS